MPKIKSFSDKKLFRLFDLGFREVDNISMSDPTRNDVGELQGRTRSKRIRAGILTVTLGLTATIVASPTVKPEDAAKPKTPTTGHHWFQIGKASWYGPRFNGRKTANGEKFDMNALTCAHRTLPLGSWIRVTNLNNQRSAFLRINDRGPLAANLIVDLSFAAARRLGVAGLAKVRIEPVTPSDPELIAELVEQMPLPVSPVVRGR